MTDGPRDRKVGDPEPTVNRTNDISIGQGIVVEVTFPSEVVTVIFNNANDASIL